MNFKVNRFILAALFIAAQLTCFGQATVADNFPDPNNFLGFESGLSIPLEIRNDNASDINFFTGTDLTAPPRMYIRSNGFIGMGNVSLPARLSVLEDDVTSLNNSDAMMVVNEAFGLSGNTTAGMFRNAGLSNYNVAVAGVIETGIGISQIAAEFASRTAGAYVAGVRSTVMVSADEATANDQTVGYDTYVGIGTEGVTVEDMYGVRSYIEGGAANYNVAVYGEAPDFDTFQPPVNLAGAFVGSVYSTETFYSSDENYKSEVDDIENADDLLTALRPVTYFYEEGSRIKASTDRHYGFISQEVNQVMPELTAPISIPEIKDPDGIVVEEEAEVKAMRYNDIIALLVAGYQGQNEELTAKDEEIKSLEAKVTSLEEQMKEIVESVEKLAAQGRMGLAPSDQNQGIILGQNVPNPFTNITKIEFELIYDTQVRLELSDAQGRVLERLIDGNLNAGRHSIEIDGSRYTAGIYFYTLCANGEMVTKKMIKK